MFCSNCNKPLTPKYFSINGFDILYCNRCLIGFTSPIPKDLSKYYHSNYWTTPGLLGEIKTAIFKIFQKRRKNWVIKRIKNGTVLDVGAGEGRFGQSLKGMMNVTSIDTPSSKIKNENVLKIDFLKWRTKKRFDVIFFWESLEHVAIPQKYLEKALTLLKGGGAVYIEYPRFSSPEAKFFRKFWFHLDPPRHLAHFSDEGLKVILKRIGYKKIYHTPVSALEYTVWGFVASILNMFGIKYTDVVKQSNNITFLLLLFPILFLSFIAQFIFLVLKQSPIGLMVAEKAD